MSQGTRPPARLDVVRMARTYQLLAEHEHLHAEGKRLPKDAHDELHDLLAANGGHVYAGRIPMRDAEHAAVDRLIARHNGSPGCLTRRDLGNSGPLLFHIDGVTYEIAASGRAKKVA